MDAKKTSWIVVVSAIVLAVIIAFSLLFTRTDQSGQSTADQIDLTHLNFSVVEKISTPDIYKAVGTIKPSTESNLESKITAKIIKVDVVPGQKVKQGQLLIELDDRDFQARVDRAKQAVEAATAIHDQSKASFKRSENLIKSGYLSKEQFDRAKSNYLSAVARLRQAEKSLMEANVELSHCQINAFADGLVLDKFVDPGDQATPGKVLLKLQTANILQLRANVPEELINKVKLDQKLAVSIDAIEQEFTGNIVEIVPNIDPQTRTFMVKANLPATNDIYPGMFGRLLIPVEMKEILVVPRSAIIEQGQLQFVKVLQENKVRKIVVTTGKIYGDKVQVISGLNPDEKIVVP